MTVLDETTGITTVCDQTICPVSINDRTISIKLDFKASISDGKFTLSIPGGSPSPILATESGLRYNDLPIIVNRISLYSEESFGGTIRSTGEVAGQSVTTTRASAGILMFASNPAAALLLDRISADLLLV